MAEPCVHKEFHATVDVGRLTDGEGGPVTAYTAEVRVICGECSEPFIWMGLPSGDLANEPTVSVDGLEARMPLRPLSAPEGFGRSRLGYSIRVEEGD